MHRVSLRMVAIAAAVLFLLAACGSDDPEAATDGDSATSTSLSTDAGSGEAEMDDTMEEGGHEHDGETVDVSDLDPTPSLELEVLVDDKGGFNVYAVPSNHTLAPESASTDHVAGEGHMHLYVDGEKVSRFYNEWLHVGDLEPGDHDFTVELSANNHSALAVDGEIVEQTVTVTQPERDEHGHSPEPVDVASLDPAPSVEITVVDDPKSGFNLHAVPSNYVLTPENVNTDDVDGEGHMHLYVGGEKLTRLYGEWYHIPDTFGAGDHEVRVELSANDHSPLAVDGVVIDATAIFTSTTEMEMDDDTDHNDDDGHEMDDDTDHNDGDDHEMTDGDHTGDTDHRVEVTYAEGAVVGGPTTIETGTGETVLLVITSDIDDEVHVHGADVFGEVRAGETTEIMFTAEIPGQFEIELEDRGQLLATLVTT